MVDQSDIEVIETTGVPAPVSRPWAVRRGHRRTQVGWRNGRVRFGWSDCPDESLARQRFTTGRESVEVPQKPNVGQEEAKNIAERIVEKIRSW